MLVQDQTRTAARRSVAGPRRGGFIRGGLGFFKRLLATTLEMRPAIGKAEAWEVDLMALTLLRNFSILRNTPIRKFQKHHHATSSRFLWKLRAERGIAMLGETGLSVAEIAYQCGFQNPFHFSRMMMGCRHSPADFRC